MSRSEAETIEKVLTSRSESDTTNIGEEFAKSVNVGDIICLYGDLGAGKTQFVKGFARHFDVDPQIVTSPTFSIIQEYQGRVAIYHFDFYRIKAPEEAIEIGVEEYFYGDGVCIIEWPQRLKAILPDDCLNIKIEQTGPDTRLIRLPKRA